MIHIIKNIAITVFIISVVILTFIAVLSIWDVLGKDVLGKSLTTIAIVGFSSLVTIVATKAIEDRGPIE